VEEEKKIGETGFIERWIRLKLVANTLILVLAVELN